VPSTLDPPADTHHLIHGPTTNRLHLFTDLFTDRFTDLFTGLFTGQTGVGPDG
jgi:hypothetical protein